MISFKRQSESLAISKEHALEGFFYFTSVREEEASKYPDYVEARLAATESVKKLATAEEAFGSARVRSWLDEIEAKAIAELSKRGAA
ncbi:7-cyano-7-deazaguanine synthase in queuosine biosynthesis [Microvirga lupini]|uniref:7-cyano-7-deazaguanine synthase in queuosine biosynthesis n=1 Tax=Microvirga lupini TaxID=420324 RepID=A0A7W4VP34_9HYPH|nr:hypothetical protein [Microvirga lupini]MBB3020683.1 7-cyano-7-deazaguanine synthase in queuosine biosynthesis [Microvirga lupini]